MKNIVSGSLFIIVAILLFYVGMPTINYGFVGFPIALLLLSVLWIFISTGLHISPDKKQVKIAKRPNKFVLYFMLVVLAYLVITPLLTSLPIFRTAAYQTLLGKVADGNKISNHIAPISIDEIRVVDEDLAHLLGEKVLGSQPALGSQVELGEFCIQKVNNDLYWVAPLLHSGFFKWMNNRSGSAGYVMVSATNERDVKLVQNIGGSPVKIKYQPKAYFQSNIKRLLYLSGYATVGLEDFSFEIDDKGLPFWVVTTFKKEIGFSGDEATGIVLINAQTGQMKEYSIANTPKWVDRIQPIKFIEEQLNDWGEYVQGYWNFSNENKLQITEGLTLVYGNDNRSYWYTGLTSVGKDESAVGFVLVDTRTKEATFYKQGGATEYAAQSSAQGKVQEKGYQASLPIPYNINNIPTYVMTLKDKGGLVKMFAMVAISDYTIVGVGNTMREALTSYKNVYNMSDNKVNPNSVSNRKVLTTVITRIQNDVKNGNSFYYFKVKDYPNIFVGSSQISSQLPVTMIGDHVTLSFDVDMEAVIDVSSFQNLDLKDK
ncbi:hypothetical protein HNP99_000234 [Flavobacterium sp. 28A]|uniref:hypothetical protein n=1 Tax=Flavobacterium sp. 28A TaxID=2735895 RepID=UPI00156F1E2B|nr:hypothetical protein [Flavobacterium sp. 28A]NRT13909.1 hypothetical protein [Flavobacterium sp. 28A]